MITIFLTAVSDSQTNNMSKPNTRIADYYSESVSDYYPNFTASWLWNTSFQSIEDPGWDPYLDFGDIASLTDGNVPGNLYSYNFSLWEQSCLISNGIQNCTSVCTNPELLFAPIQKNSSHNKSKSYLNTQVPYNILACMYYPLLSQLLGMANQSGDSWDQIRSIGEKYNIVANASEDLIEDIVNTQVECYFYYCSAQSEDLCDYYNSDTGEYQALTAPGLLPVGNTQRAESPQLPLIVPI